MLQSNILKVSDLVAHIKQDCSGCLTWEHDGVVFKLIPGPHWLAIFIPSGKHVTQVPIEDNLMVVTETINAHVTDHDVWLVDALNRAFITRCITAKHLMTSLSKNTPAVDILFRLQVVVTISICSMYGVNRLSITFNEVGQDTIDQRRILIETAPFVTIVNEIYTYLLNRLPDSNISVSEITDNVLISLQLVNFK